MCASCWPTISAWWPLKRPSSASERRNLACAAAFGELGQHLGIMGAGNQRVEHQPARDAKDLEATEDSLIPGVLQRLLQPLDLAGALLDLRLAIAGQVAQLTDRPWRHETRPDQPVLDQLADPLRVRSRSCGRERCAGAERSTASTPRDPPAGRRPASNRSPVDSIPTSVTP